MATSPMAELIHQLRSSAVLRDGAGLTDGQLLEEYISRHDEAALAALVHRHGPMVWGVCRRTLGNYQDAEDAFQATFLVLVRKATSVRPRGMVANWLYGVAHQTALKARATVSTRKGRERQVVEMPEPAAVEPAQWDELLPVLDQELSRLPDKYRAVVVLCDLEGKTRKEAARQLGVPEGTVAGWVARAREILAKRLTQRGVTLSGGALAAILSQNLASAGVPASVVSQTIKGASLLAAGRATTGVISVTVAALTEGVLKTMFLSKLKVATAVLLVVAILGGATGLICQTQAADQPKALRVKENEQPVAQKDEKPKSVKEQLQGTWTIISTVDHGTKLKKEGFEEEWSFKDATIRVTSRQKDGKSGTSTTYLRYRLDEKASPKGIDLVEAKADDLFDTAALDKRLDNADERAEGIVSIKGDTLTICYSEKNSDRPSALDSKAGSKHVLIVLKRAKDK